MIRTYVDSGVLIEAYRASGPLAGLVLAAFDAASRVFVTSDFVRLEVLPKPTYYRRPAEVGFYNAFLDAAKRSIPTTKKVVRLATQRAEQFGLNAVDALHVAAAEIGKVDELATTERPTSPLLRVTTSSRHHGSRRIHPSVSIAPSKGTGHRPDRRTKRPGAARATIGA